ncbi:hypothetical protein T10_9142 [Trichinella papuae]|uniref:Uncharacterized protein n=1 Tax=Trichinella papuae TaxID=268474 RepID=A0A0V1MDW7_9BILA|nr:hypothetical protein T10_9142 [Trichinella papuae]
MDSPDSSTSHGAHSVMVNSTGDWLAVLTAPLTSPRFLQSCSSVVYATFRRPDQYRYHMICCKSASNTNGYGSSILGCRPFSAFWEEKALVVNAEHAVHSVLAFCNGVCFYGSSILDPRHITPLIEFTALGSAVMRSNREALPGPLIQAILHNRIAPFVALSSLTYLLSWSYVGIRSYEEAVTVPFIQSWCTLTTCHPLQPSNTNGYGSSILGCRRTALDLLNHKAFSAFWEEKALVVNAEHAVHSVLAFCNDVWFYGSSILDSRRLDTDGCTRTPSVLLRISSLRRVLLGSSDVCNVIPFLFAGSSALLAHAVANIFFSFLLEFGGIIRSYECKRRSPMRLPQYCAVVIWTLTYLWCPFSLSPLYLPRKFTQDAHLYHTWSKVAAQYELQAFHSSHVCRCFFSRWPVCKHSVESVFTLRLHPPGPLSLLKRFHQSSSSVAERLSLRLIMSNQEVVRNIPVKGRSPRWTKAVLHCG